MASLTRFFGDLYRRNRPLTLLGWLQLLLVVAALAGAVGDGRQVVTSSPWTLAAGNCASFALFLFSIAWLSRHIRKPRRSFNAVSLAIALAAVVASISAFVEAGRAAVDGERALTDFDRAVSVSAAVSVSLLAASVVAALYLLKRPSTRVTPVYLWAMRAGLLSFLAGLGIGVLTLGIGEGEVGIGLLNWGRQEGDLRIAHALGVHGLQALPVLGFLLAGRGGGSARAVKLTLLAAAVLAWYGATWFAFSQAPGYAPG